jgi:hypothetical protein
MGRRDMHAGFLWKSQKEKEHYEDINVGGRIILGWILKKYNGMDWIHLAHVVDQWQALVKTVKNLRFHKIFGKFFSS